MADQVSVAPESKPEPTTARLTLTKDQAASLKIGLAVRLEVIGEVKDLSRCYNDKEKYDVTLEDPTVKNITPSVDEEKDTTDENLATMPKEKLKEKISKTPSEE